MSEGAASAKRFWFMFGAKPAQSETPVRARGQAGVHPEEDAVERRREATYEPLETSRSSPRCSSMVHVAGNAESDYRG